MVNTAKLRDSSPYFRSLLDRDKFNEGAHVVGIHERLKEQYHSIGDAPAAELPHVLIEDIGCLSRHVRPEESMTAFLKIMNGVRFDASRQLHASLSWLANLVVIADRFDALPKMKQFVREYPWLMRKYASQWFKFSSKMQEEQIRQVLFCVILLGMPEWIASFSAPLVLHGSKAWADATEDGDHGERPLWWALPGGFEGMPASTLNIRPFSH